MHGKPSGKEVWSGHVNHLNFGGTSHISGMAEARVVKCCTQRYKVLAYVDRPPQNGVVRVT